MKVTFGGVVTVCRHSTYASKHKSMMRFWDSSSASLAETHHKVCAVGAWHVRSNVLV